MQNVSNLWKQTHLQNFLPMAYVEVSYGVSNPEIEDALSGVTDNGHSSFSKIEQVISKTTKNYVKAASLEMNSWILDGSVSQPNSTPLGDFGFIGSTVSNSQYQFVPHPLITLNFSSVQEGYLPGIQIQWAAKYNEYPKTFKVTAYNGTTVKASTTISNNDETSSVVVMEMTKFNKITIEIYDWCLPSRYARIEKITLGTVKKFNRSNIISFENSQEVDLLSFSLPKSQIDFEIDNVDGEYNPDNPSGIYKFLTERQEMTVRYGYKLDDEIEWIDGGIYYMSAWNAPQNGIVAKFTARDLLEFMGDTIKLTTRTHTLHGLAYAAFEQSNLPRNKDNTVKWHIDDSLKAISITLPVDSDGNIDFNYTCAETVQLCANAACCVFYPDRNGQLYVKPFTPELSDYSITRFTQYDNAEYDISKELKSVVVNNGLGTANNGTTGEIQTVSNPLIQSEGRANIVASWIANILKNRKTLSGEYRADPRMDALDEVTVTNKYATQEVVITNIKYAFKGSFKGSYKGKIL